ncbi:MAG: hypothetical protein CM15mV124_330 [uncultured marine virus]|nr:MAG: hypothetical protein CM15mV124_330 [uncultured marine virus]
MVPNCVPVTKAAMGRAAFSETTSKAPGTKIKPEEYTGSYINQQLIINMFQIKVMKSIMVTY